MTEPARIFKPLRPDRTAAFARSRSMSQPAKPQSHDPAYNRDDAQKPGSPPRMAQEPAPSGGSSRTRKTATDPVTGETNWGRQEPNAADAKE